MKSEGMTQPDGGSISSDLAPLGKRRIKKKQKYPGEVSDWDSDEDQDDERNRHLSAKNMKKEEEYILESEGSSESSSEYSDESEASQPFTPEKSKRATPKNGSRVCYKGEKGQYSCDYCNYSNWRSCTTTTHMNRHHRDQLTCDACGFLAESVKSLKAHVEDVHTGQQEEGSGKPSSDPTKEEVTASSPGKSDDCQIKLEPTGDDGQGECNDDDFIEEEIVRVNAQPTDDLYAPTDDDDEQGSEEYGKSSKKSSKKPAPFKCSACSYSSVFKGNVDRHMRERHFRQRRGWQNPFICDECGFKANRKHILVQHVLRHTGEKPFRCDSCDYSCRLKVNLKRHKLTHTGETPFACDLCGYRCKQSYDLKKHMWTHTGVRPFACDLCDYTATQGNSLTAHKKKYHSEKGKSRKYSCDLCEFASNAKKAFESHKKTSHAVVVEKAKAEESTSKVTAQIVDNSEFVFVGVKVEDEYGEDVKVEETAGTVP